MYKIRWITKLETNWRLNTQPETTIQDEANTPIAYYYSRYTYVTKKCIDITFLGIADACLSESDKENITEFLDNVCCDRSESLGSSGHGGTTYIIWGRTTCPDVNGTELLYSGQTGKASHSTTGGGINYQCFPNNPQYSGYISGQIGSQGNLGSKVTAVDYYDTSTTIGTTNRHVVPCAVCVVNTRSMLRMIPARYTCPDGWTREYRGYLMTEKNVHASPGTFECVDLDAEDGAYKTDHANKGFFMHVEAHCNLGCPPYDANKELTCAVCTK